MTSIPLANFCACQYIYNLDARILELAKYSPVKNVRYVSWKTRSMSSSMTVFAFLSRTQQSVQQTRFLRAQNSIVLRSKIGRPADRRAIFHPTDGTTEPPARRDEKNNARRAARVFVSRSSRYARRAWRRAEG